LAGLTQTAFILVDNLLITAAVPLGAGLKLPVEVCIFSGNGVQHLSGAERQLALNLLLAKKLCFPIKMLSKNKPYGMVLGLIIRLKSSKFIMICQKIVLPVDNL